MFQKSFKVIFIVFVLFIATINGASAEIGFWRPSDDVIPEAVKKARDSVYEIIVPAGQQGKVSLKVFKSLDAVKSWVEKRKELDTDQKNLWFRQIKKCWSDKVEICTILEDTASVSGFLFSDQDSLATVSHAFSDYLELHPLSAGTVGETEVPILIKDRKEKVIFNGEDEKEAEVFLNTWTVNTDFKDNVSLDVAFVSVPKPLPGTPLVLAGENSLKNNDPVYFLGFPAKTDGRSYLGKQDSSGVGQRVTFGPAISFWQAMRTAGFDTRHFSPQLTMDYINNFIYSDADSYFGMSGGPALNKKGEVLAIERGHWPADGHASRKVFSESIKISWFKKLLELD